MMISNQKRMLVFVGDHNCEGHKEDFRSSLKRALDKITYSVFEDISKAPESIFSMMVGGILFNDVVLFDATLFAKKIPPDMLIEYGVCLALEKRAMFVAIRNN